MSEPIRVLHIVGAMYPGGLENFIMNLYEKMDRNKIQFDFVVHMRKQNDYVETIKEMGGRVYELPRLTKKPIANLFNLYRIVKNNHYRIVIRHTSNALVAPQLMAARIAGAYTICHSHNETDPQKTLHKMGKLLMGIASKENFACSQRAAKWMFGNKTCRVIHNAIHIKRFTYQFEAADKIRREFHLKEGHVYGNVANFIASKNHYYLLAIYKELSKLDPDARFFCLGDGSLRAEIEAERKRLGLEDKVILTGIRKDAQDFLSCFDVLIFPSKFEGLPLTLIEAQAAGLPCLISDTITSDVIVTSGLVETASIEAKPRVWAQKAFQMVSALHTEPEREKRKCQYTSIAKAGYDMDTLAKWYEAFFLKIYAMN